MNEKRGCKNEFLQPQKGGFMNKILKSFVMGLLSVCVASSTAFASTITPSETSISLQKGETQISFDIILETDSAFAGAEFGILPSNTDVTLESLVFSDELKNESKVQTVKDNCLYFGFFSSENKYAAGKYTVATVNYKYSGSSTRTITLKDSKIVTIDEETKKTSGDTSTPSFTVTIKRTGNGSSSGGGSSGNTGGNTTQIPDIRVPSTDQPYDNTKFEDISSHWAKEYIEKAVSKGFFNGTSETSFSPDLAVSRAMAVTVLGRFAKAENVEKQTVFTDVAENSYYASYVAWGVQQGVVKGISETEFAPDMSITREQISAMIIRYLNAAKIPLPNTSDFIKTHRDYSDISEYAVNDMTLCYDMGLITGHDTGLLAPQGNLTRAEFSVIMLRLNDYITSVQ